MIFRFITLLMAIGLFAAPSAHAKGAVRKYDACLQRAGGVHSAMLECMFSEKDEIARAIDKMLSARYADKGKDAAARKMKAQGKAWNGFVSSECSIYFDLGGQRGELLQQDCELEEARRRKAYVSDVLSAFDI